MAPARAAPKPAMEMKKRGERPRFLNVPVPAVVPPAMIERDHSLALFSARRSARSVMRADLPRRSRR